MTEALELWAAVFGAFLSAGFALLVVWGVACWAESLAYRIRFRAEVRKPPVVVNSVQMTQALRGDPGAWPDWLLAAWNDQVVRPADYPHSDGTDQLVIDTPDGTVRLPWNAWIDRGARGEVRPREDA